MPALKEARLLDILEPRAASSASSAEPEAVRQALEQEAHLVLRGPDGTEVRVPSSWETVLVRALQEVLVGHHVEMRVEARDEIGTVELARLLGVSRPTVVSLLDQRQIPSWRTPNGHRRVRLRDIALFLRQRRRQRNSIAALVAHAEEHGLPLETPAEVFESLDDALADDAE